MNIEALYLQCEAERAAAVRELDVCMANLAASEEKRKKLAEQVEMLRQEIDQLRIILAAAQGR